MASVKALKMKALKKGFLIDVDFDEVRVSKINHNGRDSPTYRFVVTFSDLPGTCTAEELMTDDGGGGGLKGCPVREEAIGLLAKTLDLRSSNWGYCIANALKGSDLDLLALECGMKKIKTYRGMEGTINVYMK